MEDKCLPTINSSPKYKVNGEKIISRVHSNSKVHDLIKSSILQTGKIYDLEDLKAKPKLVSMKHAVGWEL